MVEALLHWLPMLGALLGAGAVGGLLAGLLGVGGGIVIVPVLDAALNLAGVSPDASLHVAVATSMATIIPNGCSTKKNRICGARIVPATSLIPSVKYGPSTK